MRYIKERSSTYFSQHTLQNTELRTQNTEHRTQNTETHVHNITYRPLIDTALSVMVLMRADSLRGQLGGGWALKIETFLGAEKWHRAVPLGECHLGPKKSRQFLGPNKS